MKGDALKMRPVEEGEQDEQEKTSGRGVIA
jgi:hypothetical protein